MSRADKEAAAGRMAIRNAKLTDTFMNRSQVYVLYEEETATERPVYLPHQKFWRYL